MQVCVGVQAPAALPENAPLDTNTYLIVKPGELAVRFRAFVLSASSVIGMRNSARDLGCDVEARFA